MICSHCNTEVENENVAYRSSKSVKCKTCAAAYMRAYFKARPDKAAKQRQRVTSSKTARRAIGRAFVKWLKEQPCMDCGIQYPSYVMEVDHRDPQQKRQNVSKIGFNAPSGEALMEEVRKCDLVCANCHRERTHQRGYRRLIPPEGIEPPHFGLEGQMPNPSAGAHHS